jgi:hypothetical protein
MSRARVLNDPSLFKLQEIRGHPKKIITQVACGIRQAGYALMSQVPF